MYMLSYRKTELPSTGFYQLMVVFLVRVFLRYLHENPVKLMILGQWIGSIYT